MRHIKTLLTVIAGLAGMTVASAAASLQVAPVRIDVPPAVSASKLTLTNTGDMPINAQVRIFKWTQSGGQDKLTETRDVVASPPIAELQPGMSNVIRIVRTSKATVGGEETYRILVDQIPPARNKPGMGISFVLRYSIPVFFNSRDERGASLKWAVETKGKQAYLTIVNAGDAHVRLSRLSMKMPGGKNLNFGPGLTGYILANSTARFPLKGGLQGAKPGQILLISAEGNDGPVQAKAEIRAAN